MERDSGSIPLHSAALLRPYLFGGGLLCISRLYTERMSAGSPYGPLKGWAQKPYRYPDPRVVVGVPPPQRLKPYNLATPSHLEQTKP